MDHKAISALVAVTVALVIGGTMTGVVSAVIDGQVSWYAISSPVYVWDDTFTVSGIINEPVPGGADAYVFAIGTDSQLHRVSDKVAVASNGAFSKDLDISGVLQPTNTWNGGDVVLVIGYFSGSSWLQWGSGLTVHIIGPSEFSLVAASTPIAGHDLALSGTIKYDEDQQVPATDVRVDIYKWPTSQQGVFVATTTAIAGTGEYSLTIPASELALGSNIFAAFITDSDTHIKTKSNELRFTIREDPKQDAIDAADALIKDDTIAFAKANNHKPFDSKLSEVMNYIIAEDYATALAKVQKDLLPKADGAKPDWVTATSQPDVYAQLRLIESDLIALLPT